MSQMFMQFPLALVGAFSVMMLLVHAQDGSDFISIDCGLQQNSDYTDSTTTIRYVPDTNFIDTGEGKTVSREYKFQQQFWFVRIFPKGTRNCYKINNIKSGQKYLIRASFGYGNYDGENNLPEFELHLGTSLWDSVVITSVSTIIIKELIHIPMRNYIHVCMVDINKGVPFISTIELRRLRDKSYQTEVGSLALIKRQNMAVNHTIYRYPNDVNDRIWNPEFSVDWEELSTSSVIDKDQTPYQLPSDVMSTAATPADISSKYLSFSWEPVVGKNASYYIYMHFAEVEEISASWSRELTITMNGELISKPFVPRYLNTTTINTTIAAEGGQYDISIYAPAINYRSILNAYEIYMEKEFLVSETNQQDVEAITNLKSTYKIIKNWQGDPCNPQVYLWEGVKCSYSDNDSARIISLDLSSSGLTGEIAASIANLTMIQTLDLSNNNLSGQIPEYLSQLPELNVLNLKKNELTGSVPAGLIAKRKDGLSLSLCGNPGLSEQVSCEKKKNKFAIPVVVSIVVVLLVSSIAAAILWTLKKFPRVLKYVRLGKGTFTEPDIEQNSKGHDVFLSFRGPDTREGFARNLYEALEKKGIKTFFDDKKLKKGDAIARSLLDAIEASNTSVIIFSKNYVTSRWCLDELVKIHECKKSKDQRVIPVFYLVNPTDVRHQNVGFSLECIHKEKVKVEWGAALEEVASLAGHHHMSGPGTYEYDFIDEIVKDISDFNEEKKKNSLNRFDTICPPDGENQVVIYVTSSAKDKDFRNCDLMLRSLTQFDLKLSQRDVSNRKFRREMRNLMKKKETPPRLFVNGKYVGGYDEVRKLIEDEPWFCETLKKFPGIDEVNLHGRSVVQQEVAGSVSVSETEIDGRSGSPV